MIRSLYGRDGTPPPRPRCGAHYLIVLGGACRLSVSARSVPRVPSSRGAVAVSMMRTVPDDARTDALRRWLDGNDAALVEWLDGARAPLRPPPPPGPARGPPGNPHEK